MSVSITFEPSGIGAMLRGFTRLCGDQVFLLELAALRQERFVLMPCGDVGVDCSSPASGAFAWY